MPKWTGTGNGIIKDESDFLILFRRILSAKNAVVEEGKLFQSLMTAKDRLKNADFAKGKEG